MRAFWNYYRTVSLFNLAFSTCVAVISLNPLWLPLMYATLGIPVAILAFNSFFKQQYYFYYNLGYTKQKLMQITFGINLLLSLPVLLIIVMIT